MSRQRPLHAGVIALALVTAGFGTAHASKRNAHLGPHLTHTGPVIPVGPVSTLDAACDLGALYTPADVYEGYIDVESGPDTYYAKVDPLECTECPSDSQFIVNQVHLTFQFPVPCTQPVTVTFVGTKVLGACPVAPNERNVMATYDFNLPGVPSIDQTGAPRFDLNLPVPVLLTHTAYVGVTFNTFNDCNTPDATAHTNLIIADSTVCYPCRYFNYYVDASGLFAVDYCQANSPPGSCRTTDGCPRFGPPVISVSGTCGTFVPTLPASWGQLKIRYGNPRRRRRRRVRARPIPGSPRARNG